MKKGALVPQYMTEFKCIGAECEDTCCAMWKVTIDQETYNKYTKISKTELRKKVKDNLVKSDKGNFYDYAHMKLNPATGDCNMLEGGLCRIQAELGEHYLSTTCSTYPRKFNNVNQVMELSGTVSCPEVTRLALLNPEGIEFLDSEIELMRNHRIENTIETNKSNSGGIYPYFWDIRILSIEILQNRQFDISHRLLILGILCERLDDLVRKNEFDAITNLTNSFRVYVEEDQEIKDYSTFPVNNEFQLKILNTLLMERMEKIVWNKRYKECVDMYIEGMQQCKSTSIDDIVAHFEQAHKQWYNPYFEERQYIFENYLVNQLFGSLFPLSKYEGIFHAYMMIVINYSLIKLHLIGMATHNNGLTDELVIQLIQSYAKNFEHSNVFIQHVYQTLKDKEYTTIGHMSLLVKN